MTNSGLLVAESVHRLGVRVSRQEALTRLWVVAPTGFEPVFESRWRFRSMLRKVRVCLVPKNPSGLKPAGCSTLRNWLKPCRATLDSSWRLVVPVRTRLRGTAIADRLGSTEFHRATTQGAPETSCRVRPAEGPGGAPVFIAFVEDARRGRERDERETSAVPAGPRPPDRNRRPRQGAGAALPGRSGHELWPQGSARTGFA